MNRNLELQPCQIDEVELSEELPTLLARSTNGGAYGKSQILVKLHSVPIGTLDVPLNMAINKSQLDALIRQQLGSEIAHHMSGDEEHPCHFGLGAGEDAPLVSVVVCSIRSETLGLCLDSLLANDYPNFEVLVIDNNPRDPQVRAVADLYAGGVVRTISEWTPGLSQARNTGMRHAKGDIVAFTDDDAIVDPGWLHAIAAAFGADAGAAAVTGPVLAAELDSEAQVLFEGHGNFPKRFHRRSFDLNVPPSGSPFYPFNPASIGVGANLSLRLSLLPDGFTFDTNLGAGTYSRGGEDMDCIVRILYAGRRIAYEPRVLVRHRHRREHSELFTMMYNYGVGNAAFLTKQMLTKDRRADLLRKLPAAFRYARSSRIGTPSDGWPRRLVGREVRGLLSGPFCYLRCRMSRAESRSGNLSSSLTT